MRHEYDIFISHSKKDTEIITKLVDKLKVLGFKVWMDDFEISPGEAIVHKIFAGLEKSRCLVIWLTKNSIDSKWVLEELERKYHQRIVDESTVVIPLLGEKCKIPYMLEHLKYIDFTFDFETGFNDLIFTISSFSGVIIEEMKQNLIVSNFPEDSAKRLIQIALGRHDHDALDALWIAINQTDCLHSIIDHCAWGIGEIAFRSKNDEIRKAAINYIYKSVEHESTLFHEKFAYTSQRLYSITKDSQLKLELLGFIKSNTFSKRETVKNEYTYIMKKYIG